MTSSSHSSRYPVTAGRSLNDIQLSYLVLGEIGDSALELQLNLGGSVFTFDRIIRAAKLRSHAGSLHSAHLSDKASAAAAKAKGTCLSVKLSQFSPTDLAKDFNDKYAKNEDLSIGLKHSNSLNYLKRKKIFELFNYFLVHLLSEKPDDPVQFLLSLLNQCLYFRSMYSGRKQPPLLFSTDHVQTVFRAFDFANTGYITVKQYREAMLALGIGNCEENNQVDHLGRVTETAFVAEAKRRLYVHLYSLIT